MDKKLVISIIGGTGRMGTFFKHFFERNGFEVLISGRSTKLTYQEACQKADVVIVSVPITDAPRVIKEIIPFLRKDSLLVDFSSLKEKTMQAMSQGNNPYLGIHPLFGQLVTSLENQVLVFCPGPKKHPNINLLEDLFKKNGAKIITLSAKEHDEQMALIQTLVHFTNITLAKVLLNSKVKLNPDLTTPIFKLQSLIIGRIFGQSAELYSNIAMENPATTKVLERYIREASSLIKLIQKNDREEFEKQFNKIKDSLGSFISVAEQKTTDVLNLVDTQPIKTQTKIISVSNKDVSVAYLGPEGTYSELATLKLFSHTQNLIPTRTITEVFNLVNDGKVDLGVVPSENSLEGSVKETIDDLVSYPVEILADYYLPINHCLISKGKALNKIKVVKSHPQALGQCRNYLKTNLPSVLIESANSTTGAIEETKEDTVAFIASEQAAKHYQLNILAKNIGDNPTNQTEFYVIGRAKSNLFEQEKTKAILLLTAYDRVGVLRDILAVIAEKGFNLSRILSISSGQPKFYLFLIDINIKGKPKEYQKVLTELQQYCSNIRILGEI